MNNKKVTVVGSVNYDIIFQQSRLPEIGETLTADSVSFSGGGKGANQAVQCAKLGLETFMVGKVGNDGFGTKLLADLKEYGVDTSFIGTGRASTGLGVVNAVDDGKVTATIYKGANYDLTCADIDQAEKLIADSGIVILQLEVPRKVVEYTIDMAKRHNCYVILNAAPASEIAEEKLNLVDCLVVNETEASYYTGRKVSNQQEAEAVCEELFKRVSGLLVLTLGEKGSILYNGKKAYQFEAEKVDAVETTGAGDSYIGAIAYALTEDFPYEKMGHFAARISAKTVMKVGGQQAMPYLSEVT